MVFAKYSQVLQVAAGELLVGDDLDLAVTLLGDEDGLAEVTGAALNLDAVVKELLESLEIEDLVVDGLRAVDDELLGDLLALLGRGAGGTLLHCTLAYCSVRGSAFAQPSGQQSGVRTVAGILIVGWRIRKEVVILRWASGGWKSSKSSRSLSFFARCGRLPKCQDLRFFDWLGCRCSVWTATCHDICTWNFDALLIVLLFKILLHSCTWYVTTETQLIWALVRHLGSISASQLVRNETIMPTQRARPSFPRHHWQRARPQRQ